MIDEPGSEGVIPAIEEASRQVLEHLGLTGEDWAGLITQGQLAFAAGSKETTLPGQRPWDYAYGAASEIIYAGCQERDQLAYHWLRGYFFGIFKNHHKLDEISAEDLAGDVVEIVLKKLGQVRFPTAFLVWATQVCQNVFKDYLSKKGRLKTVILSKPDRAEQAQTLEKVQAVLRVTEMEIPDTSPGANPETVALDHELRAQLLNIIQGMRSNTRNSQLYKRIIVGFYLEEKTMEELADLLDLTPLKVTKLKSQALLNLRKTWLKYPE